MRFARMTPRLLSLALASALILPLAAPAARADHDELVVITLVPDVVGRDAELVVERLGSHYELEIVEAVVPGAPEGQILQQEPRAGSRLALGGALRLTVARTPAPTAESVVVPSLAGLRFSDAERRILDVGLVPLPTFQRSVRARPYFVAGETPLAGHALELGARVPFRVEVPYRGSERLPMPSLIGLDAREAAAVLASLGLSPHVEQEPAFFAPGTVFRQAPAAGGFVTAGQWVRVVAATHTRMRTPDPTRTPDFRGQSLAQAFQLARDAAVQVSLRRVPAPDAAPDRVLGQQVEAGRPIRVGTRVLLDLPVLAEVPELTGLFLRDARRIAAEAGFELVIDDFGGRRLGLRVVRQSVPAGAVLARGSRLEVDVEPEHPAALSVVPDLRGLSVREAEERLRHADLVARFVGPRIPGVMDTEVVSQSIAARTRVARGTEIQVEYRLRVTAPTPPPAIVRVRVPDLRGLTAVDAHRVLAAAGLVARPSFVRGAGPERVTGQSPDAGTLVASGSEVAFTVTR